MLVLPANDVVEAGDGRVVVGVVEDEQAEITSTATAAIGPLHLSRK